MNKRKYEYSESSNTAHIIFHNPFEYKGKVSTELIVNNSSNQKYNNFKGLDS